MNKQKINKMIQFFLKIIYYLSIISLCLWGVALILRIFLPLEFANHDSEMIYIKIRFYWFIISAVLLILTGVIERKHTLNLIITKIILSFGIVGFSIFVTMGIIIGSVCGWTVDDKVFFENKQNSSIKIIMRNYDCGALDSSYPDFRPYKVRKISDNFNWATKIDTTKINRNEWIRIENKKVEN